MQKAILLEVAFTLKLTKIEHILKMEACHGSCMVGDFRIEKLDFYVVYNTDFALLYIFFITLYKDKAFG